MADQRLRALERQGPSAALLRERMRAGVRGPLGDYRVGVELAAYCGSKEAREVLPDSVYSYRGLHVDECGYGFFLRGLERWGTECTVRAALAAAEVAQVATCFDHNPHCTRTRCTPILRVFAAIRDWLSDFAHANAPDFSGCPDVSWLLALDAMLHDKPAKNWEYGIAGAASVAGEQPVREAICKALIEWALNG